MKNVIAVDIGGTNSRFGHFRISDEGRLSYVDGLRLKTHSASSLDDLMEMARNEGPIAADTQWDVVVLAVPGAVKDNTYAKLANVPWAVDVSGLRTRATGARIFLINDFVAQAFACPLTSRLNTQIVQNGEPQAAANVAVVGAGTGLGHCALAPTGGGAFLPLPSEAGHATFAFYGKTETAYRDYLLERTGAEYPYGDIVVSGPGLTHLHAFLTGRDLDPADVIGEITPKAETTVLFCPLLCPGMPQLCAHRARPGRPLHRRRRCHEKPFSGSKRSFQAGIHRFGPLRDDACKNTRHAHPE